MDAAPSASRGQYGLADLPYELLMHVAARVDKSGAAGLRATCRRGRAAVNALVTTCEVRCTAPADESLHLLITCL